MHCLILLLGVNGSGNPPVANTLKKGAAFLSKQGGTWYWGEAEAKRYRTSLKRRAKERTEFLVDFL